VTLASYRALIRAYVDGNHDQFRSVALQIAASLRGTGLFPEIKAMIDRLPPMTHALTALPKSVKSGDELLDQREPTHALGDLVLGREVVAALRGLVEEHALADRLHEMGLLPSLKVIFDGPPGTGKTSAAGAVARTLGWPFVVARHDSLISSYMGETGSNLRKVFDFASSTRCVLLFDEFDSFGLKRRGGSQSAEGEMGRALNLILQQMDRHRGPSILIAATNLPDALDQALNRRFDLAVKFELPTEDQRRELIHRVLGEPDGPFSGSHAEIVRDAMSERKRRILQSLRHPS